MRVFEEKQRFDQWWFYAIQAVVVFSVLYLAYDWYQHQYLMGATDRNEEIVMVLVVVLTVIPISILSFLKLQTRIDERGIHYRFFPFHRNERKIEWQALKQCYTRKYNPIKEYGGWGYRISFGKGKAYNVKGNQGIQLETQDGKKVLLGTQKPKEAQQVIDRYFNNEGI